MAGIWLGSVLQAYGLAITALLYIALAIFVIKARSSPKKLHIIIIIAGVFFIIYSGIFDFWRSQLFILGWFTVNGVPMMIDRTTAIILFFVLAGFMLFLPMVYFPVSLGIYTLIIFGMLHDAFLPKKE